MVASSNISGDLNELNEHPRNLIHDKISTNVQVRQQYWNYKNTYSQYTYRRNTRFLSYRLNLVDSYWEFFYHIIHHKICSQATKQACITHAIQQKKTQFSSHIRDPADNEDVDITTTQALNHQGHPPMKPRAPPSPSWSSGPIQVWGRSPVLSSLP